MRINRVTPKKLSRALIIEEFSVFYLKSSKFIDRIFSSLATTEFEIIF